jgi:hypothetical protein
MRITALLGVLLITACANGPLPVVVTPAAPAPGEALLARAPQARPALTPPGGALGFGTRRADRTRAAEPGLTALRGP